MDQSTLRFGSYTLAQDMPGRRLRSSNDSGTDLTQHSDCIPLHLLLPNNCLRRPYRCRGKPQRIDCIKSTSSRRLAARSSGRSMLRIHSHNSVSDRRGRSLHIRRWLYILDRYPTVVWPSAGTHHDIHWHRFHRFEDTLIALAQCTTTSWLSWWVHDGGA